MSIGSSRGRDERGAVAVLVAILSVVVFGAAALTIDIGNAWARRREVQTQVDVSALSAGHLLPWTDTASKDAIAKEVARYLNKNLVQGQSAVAWGDLRDLDPNNGDIKFLAGGNQIQVVAPRAWVQFGVGKAVSNKSGTSVLASATIELQSPLPPSIKVLPFAMPASCPFGPGMADTTSHAPKDTSGTWTAPTPKSGDVASVVPTPNPIPGGDKTPVSLQVVLSNLDAGLTSAQVIFQSGGAVVPGPTATWTTPTSTSGSPKDDSRTINVSVPADVLNTAGTWNVYGITGSKYTKSSQSIVVGTPPSTTEIGCDSSASGEFGQMYSPRGNQPADQQGLALNIAQGLDHNLTPWINAPQIDCGKKTQPPPVGGVQDTPNQTSTPNCILPQTGNDGPWMLKGLITGDTGYKGRLDVTNPKGRATKSGCGTGNDTTDWPVTINNDHLTCYLLKGSLSDLASQSTNPDDFAGLLDPDVVNSPRFCWIPVIYATTRADIDNNTFYALKRFVPAFITDDGSTHITPQNGVLGNTTLSGIQVFTFNPLALPVDQQSPTMPYDPLMGRIIHLID